MADAPRSSFIPKQITGTTPVTVRRKRVFSVVSFITGVLLVGSILAAGGVFLYRSYLERGLAEQRDALNAEYRKFDESEIASVKTFDRRLRLAEYLLAQHTSPSSLFDALEVNTKSSVQYTKFSYERRPSGGITLGITGVTDEFEKVSLQWMAYLRDEVLADATLTRLVLGEEELPEEFEEGVPALTDSQVAFELRANFDVSQIPYTAPSGGPLPRSPFESGSADVGAATSTPDAEAEELSVEEQTGGGGATAPGGVGASDI